MLTIAINLLVIQPSGMVQRADCSKTLVHQVPVQSGAPSLLPGDHVISERIDRKSSPSYGELALYRDRQHQIATFGRVVGRPGDHILIDRNQVHVNGTRLLREEPGQVCHPPWTDQTTVDSADYRMIREWAP